MGVIGNDLGLPWDFIDMIRSKEHLLLLTSPSPFHVKFCWPSTPPIILDRYELLGQPDKWARIFLPQYHVIMIINSRNPNTIMTNITTVDLFYFVKGIYLYYTP